MRPPSFRTYLMQVRVRGGVPGQMLHITLLPAEYRGKRPNNARISIRMVAAPAATRCTWVYMLHIRMYPVSATQKRVSGIIPLAGSAEYTRLRLSHSGVGYFVVIFSGSSTSFLIVFMHDRTAGLDV